MSIHLSVFEVLCDFVSIKIDATLKKEVITIEGSLLVGRIDVANRQFYLTS